MAKAQTSSERFDKCKLLAPLSQKSFCCSASWQDNPSRGLAVCREVNFSKQHAAIRQRRHKPGQKRTEPLQEGPGADAAVKCQMLPAHTLLLTLCVCVCLQAVETNLASKDSHWVFVNEVRDTTLISQTFSRLQRLKQYLSSSVVLTLHHHPPPSL